MTKKRIKRYKVSADDSLGLAFSVVDKPAVESNFTYLSEQKIEKFVGVDGERRMIYGCALRPSFPIYRNNGEEEYYLEFTKEAIDKMSKNYFKMGFQSSWTEAHKDEVEGLTITESWIKESMTADKSIALGLDPSLPIGSWFLGCYCENDEVWEKVKEGKYNGFSIEAIIGVEEFESQINEINNDSMINIDEMSFWTKMKEVLSEAFSKKEEEPIEPIDITDLEEQTPPPTDETPKVEEAPKVEEPKVEEPKAEEPKVEEPKTDEQPRDEQGRFAPKEDENVKHLEGIIASMKEEVEALKKMNNGLNEKINELSKEPSAKPISIHSSRGGDDKGVYSSAFQNWRETMKSMM